MLTMLNRILRSFVLRGQLTVYWPDGSSSQFCGTPGPAATIRINNRGTIRRLISNPGLAIGEAYMDGGLRPVGCSIRQVLEVFVCNLSGGGSHIGQRLQVKLRKTLDFLLPANSAHRARKNVAHHYDLNNRLYKLFLDADMQYSCAYFETADASLEDAQAEKKRRIAAKLLLDRPNLDVLDIGCGWGGLALTLARDYGARVTGITLSTEQLTEARRRAKEMGLGDRVSFELLDYRAITARFDRVVSVGMFEHVGVRNYSDFFATVNRCLKPDGIALIHSIGNSGPPIPTSAWLTKYIFPGGYSPSLSEVLPCIEQSGLAVTDVEILRSHYAKTLACWQKRFQANRGAVIDLYDERFCRMWEFYLAGCELAFLYLKEMVVQIQLARDPLAVPITRSYLWGAGHVAGGPSGGERDLIYQPAGRLED
jgi:cyclopropane-fatty-acyl-phospholipid synthase